MWITIGFLTFVITFKIFYMKKVLSVSKFLLLLSATLLVCVVSDKWIYIPFCLMELVLLFVGCGMVSSKCPRLAYAINVILSFLYSAQLFVYYFSGEFISMLMLDNLNMISNLGNELVIYVLVSIPAVAVVLMPSGNISFFAFRKMYVLAFAAVYLLIMAVGWSVLPASPYTATFSLAKRMVKARIFKIWTSRMDKDEILEYFRRESVGGLGVDAAFAKNGEEQLSVVLILTEGLSAEVLDVYNSLGLSLTPNLDSLYHKSLVFDNYYNHTAATFRAVRGQLYSSHQYDGGYVGGAGLGEVDNSTQSDMLNTKLVSIVDILKSRKGYNTCFVNPEPADPKIVNYLYSLGVDDVVSGDYGHTRSRTDRQIYDVLKNTIRQYRSCDAPFFIVFYNIGTHHGFDSPDLKYGDGSNAYLNKFHNYDAAFGDFFQEMDEEGVFENTLLVFSADHATYPVPEYRKTFDSSQEVFVSKIPLFFYFDGIVPEIRDAQGRNSLDITPTLLDILNVRDVENWFLGTSLFRDYETWCSRVCAMGDEFFYVSDGQLNRLEDGDSRVKMLRKYYEISINKKKNVNSQD